jgi:hypothetical protein
MEAFDLVCLKCKHFKRFDGGCFAFPNGIPDDILSGFNNHSNPLPNQGNKIVFELETPIKPQNEK